MEEQWREISGHDGYMVSDHGRVCSSDRLILGKDGRKELHHGKILKPWRSKNGYLLVTLPGRAKRTVHSLVAEAFLGDRPDGYDVMHIDGDRANNVLSNLRYGTRSENLRQAYDYGGRIANGKLYLDDAKDVKRRLAKGEHPIDLAKEYGVHSAAIYHIRNGAAFAWVEV